MRSKHKTELSFWKNKGTIGFCGQVIFGCGYQPWVFLMTFNLYSDSPSHSLLHSCLPHPQVQKKQVSTANMWECLHSLHPLVSLLVCNFAAQLDLTQCWLLSFVFTLLLLIRHFCRGLNLWCPVIPVVAYVLVGGK